MSEIGQAADHRGASPGFSGAPILVLACSANAGGAEARLAGILARELALAGSDVRHVSLGDYPLPLLDDSAARPLPDNARKLAVQLDLSQVIVLVCGERNGSLTAPVKNMIDWLALPAYGHVRSISAWSQKTVVALSVSAIEDRGRSLAAHLAVILQAAGAEKVDAPVTLRMAEIATWPEPSDTAQAIRALVAKLAHNSVSTFSE